MPRKRDRVLLVLFTAVLSLLALAAGPGLMLRALGFERQGTVEAVLAAPPPQATEEAVGEPLGSITIQCPHCEDGVWTISAQELKVLELTGGLNDEGRPEYRLVFDEEGFNRFFQTQVEPWLPVLRDTPYRNLWFDLREGGAVVRAEIDVSRDFSLPSGVPYLGVYLGYTGQVVGVSEVLPLGPADRAGLKAGDVISIVDGVPARPEIFVSEQIQGHVPGDVIVLEIMREGQEMTLEVELGEWSDGATWHSLGLVLTPDVTGSRLVPLGLSAGEDLYSLPKTGPLAAAIADGERVLDELLDHLVVVGPLEGQARVASFGLTENGLTVVMR